jgi:hypothetical protein
MAHTQDDYGGRGSSPARSSNERAHSQSLVNGYREVKIRLSRTRVRIISQ